MRNPIAMTGLSALVLVLVACGNNADAGQNGLAEGEAMADDGAGCPDDGARLPITGICAARAVNYLNVADGEAPQAPEGCQWVVQETRFAEDVLLYRAAQCDGKTTRLAFAGGAGLAELSYDTAAYGDPDNVMKGQVVARVASADATDKTASLLRIARDAIDDPAEKAGCTVRNARIEGWPRDALVVDVSEAEAAKAPQDEPRAACGPFGLNEDEASYWRVFQGQSWYFQLSQDALQIDPGSFTLMRKGADGRWSQTD